MTFGGPKTEANSAAAGADPTRDWTQDGDCEPPAPPEDDPSKPQCESSLPMNDEETVENKLRRCDDLLREINDLLNTCGSIRHRVIIQMFMLELQKSIEAESKAFRDSRNN